MRKGKNILGLGALAIVALFLSTRAKAKPEIWACPVCSMEFSSLEELQAHFATIHPREPLTITWE